MSRTTDFTHVNGVAVIDWTLKTETPLCIKSGTVSACSTAGGVDFWTKSTNHDKEGSVFDFYFDVRLNEESPPRIYFRIPASSIRGALRNYTIRRLVPKDLRRAGLFPKKDDPEMESHKALFKKAVKDGGWHLIQNLFGLAAETSEQEMGDETVAGRIQFISDDCICSLTELNHTSCPLSAVSRSPLDRATRGTKSGGLHSFMELKTGYEFNISLRVINPIPEDLGFIYFWERSINQGLLRLGGLASVGKGRLKVEKTDVRLFLSDKNKIKFPDQEQWDVAAALTEDILGGIFPEYKLPWPAYRKNCLSTLKNHYEHLKSQLEK